MIKKKKNNNNSKCWSPANRRITDYFHMSHMIFFRNAFTSHAKKNKTKSKTIDCCI